MSARATSGPPDSRTSGPSSIRRALRFGVWEAAVVAGMFAFTEAWLIPILQKQLGAPAWVVGTLAMLPQLAIMFLGPWSLQIARSFGGARATALRCCWWHISLLAALSVPLWFPEDPLSLPLAIALASLHGVAGVVGGPAWVAWMGDLIPPSVRGRYHANRMAVFAGCKLGFAALFTGLVVATDPGSGISVWGMQALIALAVLSRMASWWWMVRQHQPPPRPVVRNPDSTRRAGEHPGLLGFIRTMHRTDIGRWTIVWSTLHIGAASMGPFIAYYMVLDGPGGLGLSGQANWWSYTTLLYTSTIVRLLCYPAAGRLVDRFGPAAMLRLAVLGITIVPLAWAVSTDWWILFIGEVFSGMVWCLAEIAVGSLLFACHRDPERRAELIGYHAAVTGVGVVLGTLVGTLGSRYLPPLDGNAFQTLFLVSMALRVPTLVIAFRLLPRLRELGPDDHHHFLDLIPGVHLSRQVGRGLSGVFARPD